MALQDIFHVRDQHHALAVLLALAVNLQGKMQTFFQSRGIQDTDNGGKVFLEQGVLEGADGDPLFLRDGMQRVDAGIVHQARIRAGDHGTRADVHGDAGEIRHLLVQPRHLVEQKALARVGGADEEGLPHAHAVSVMWINAAISSSSE